MLVSITYKCQLDCTHCFNEQRGPDGKHMSLKKFDDVLVFARKLGIRVLVLSGGEPTLHPLLLDILHRAAKAKMIPVVPSNGAFATNKKLCTKLLDFCDKHSGLIQVTNDKRFYPQRLPESSAWSHPVVCMTDHIEMIRPCRRVKENGIEPESETPNCVNLRILTRNSNLRHAMYVLERERGRLCLPSVDIDGTVRVGEPDTCHPAGQVTDNIEYIEQRIRQMKCSRCGLVKNLPQKYKAAIGESSGIDDVLAYERSLQELLTRIVYVNEE